MGRLTGRLTGVFTLEGELALLTAVLCHFLSDIISCCDNLPSSKNSIRLGNQEMYGELVLGLRPLP